jgi:hypothetical protein
MRERVTDEDLFGIFYYSRQYGVKREGRRGQAADQKLESSRLWRIVDNSRKRILTGGRRGYIL